MLYQREYLHGGDIYSEGIDLDFSVSTNPFGAPDGVLEAMREAVSRTARYPDPYCRAAVKAVSEYENADETHILVGNGAAELIHSYCEALKPRRVLEAVPAFSEYEAALEGKDCGIVRFALQEKDDFSLPGDFPGCIRKTAPDAVFLCHPNNPTGRLIDPDLLTDILNTCAGMGISLFVDECFLELSDDPFDLTPFVKSRPELFILKAFTKSYALAGIRLGYCLCSDTALLAKMARTVQPWNVSVIAQAAAAAVLKEKDHPARARAMITGERARLKASLEELGFRVCRSDANFLLFKGPAGLDRELRKERIAIRNCESFSGLGPGWYRIGIRQPAENDILLRMIRKVLGKES